MHIVDVHAARMVVGFREGRLLATGLPWGTRLLDGEAAGDAHVRPIGVHRLLQERRGRCLVAKAAQARRLHGLVVGRVEAPADAVVVRVVGIGVGADVRLRHRGEQAQPDQLRRNARRKQDAVLKIPIAQLAHGDHRPAQRERRAVVVSAGHGFVFHRRKAFADGRFAAPPESGQAGVNATLAVEGGQAEGVQQGAVGGVWNGFAGGVHAETQADGHGIHRGFRVRRRGPASIAGMATLARSRVQERPFAIVGIAENLIAGLEVRIGAEVALNGGRALPKRLFVAERGAGVAAREALLRRHFGHHDGGWRGRWRWWRGGGARTAATTAPAARNDHAGEQQPPPPRRKRAQTSAPMASGGPATGGGGVGLGATPTPALERSHRPHQRRP